MADLDLFLFLQMLEIWVLNISETALVFDLRLFDFLHKVFYLLPCENNFSQLHNRNKFFFIIVRFFPPPPERQNLFTVNPRQYCSHALCNYTFLYFQENASSR